MNHFWILVILITKPTGTAVTSIPTFFSQNSCVEAAKTISSENGTQIGTTQITYTCVKNW